MDDTTVDFHTIFESLPDPIAVCDDEGRLVAMNREARALLGVDPDEDVRLNLRSRETVRQMRMTPTGAPSGDFYLADVPVEGAVRPRVSASLHPIGESGFRVHFSVGPDGRSVSPNVRIMESLVNVGRHLELLKSPDKTIALFAASLADVFGRYSFRIVLGEDVRHDQAAWGGGARSDVSTTTAGPNVPADELIFEGAGRGWRMQITGPGGPMGYLQVERQEDQKFRVAERQAFETFVQQIGLAASRFGVENNISAVGPIIDQLDAIVVVCDARRRILVCNRTFEAMVGSSPVGLDILEFVDEQARPRLRTSAAAVMAGGESEPIDLHLRTHEEGQVSLRVHIAPAHGGSGGSHTGFVVTGQHSELSLVELEERMTRAEQLMNLGQLATGVAHELKNPLTSILNYAEYLLRKYEDSFFEERDSQRLQRIIDGVQRMDDFVQDLMVLARPSDGERRQVSLHTLVRESGFMCEVALRQARSRLKLRFMEDDPIIVAQGNQLKQVFVNLFANAAESMGEEGGEIAVQTHRDEEWVVVAVADDGAGMDEETVERVFEPFYTTRDGRGGSGLGLALVRTIVRRHGGEIEVDSELGVGTTFTIRLPLVEG
jgi:signal transduction histidine kinase